jgi:hypothetical protein
MIVDCNLAGELARRVNPAAKCLPPANDPDAAAQTEKADANQDSWQPLDAGDGLRRGLEGEKISFFGVGHFPYVRSLA